MPSPMVMVMYRIVEEYKEQLMDVLSKSDVSALGRLVTNAKLVALDLVHQQKMIKSCTFTSHQGKQVRTRSCYCVLYL